jgi:hypothetical protein
MAVGTSVGIPGGLMVMKKASEKSENEDRNNGNWFGRVLRSDAPPGMLESHAVVSRHFAEGQFSRAELPLFTKIL